MVTSITSAFHPLCPAARHQLVPQKMSQFHAVAGVRSADHCDHLFSSLLLMMMMMTMMMMMLSMPATEVMKCAHRGSLRDAHHCYIVCIR